MREEPRLTFELGMPTDVLPDNYFGRLIVLLRHFLKVGSMRGITIQYINVGFDKPYGWSELDRTQPCVIRANITCKNITVNFAGGHLLKVADYVLSFPFQYQKGTGSGVCLPSMAFKEFERLFRLAGLKALQDAVDTERRRNQDFESWFAEARELVPGLK